MRIIVTPTGVEALTVFRKTPEANGTCFPKYCQDQIAFKYFSLIIFFIFKMFTFLFSLLHLWTFKTPIFIIVIINYNKIKNKFNYLICQL
jgi:hypothetical protein